MPTHTWIDLPVESGGGGGGVNSVTATDPLFSTLGSDPNISFVDVAPNLILAGPISGPNAEPTFRSLSPADFGTFPTNTFAGFDNSGFLESVPGFNIDTTSGGMNEQLTEHPNNGGGATANSFNVNFEPLQNSPDENWNIQNIQAVMDNASSGFSQGTNGAAVQLINLGFLHHGTGDTGRLNYINLNSDLGNGTDPIVIKGLSFSNGFTNVHASVTMDASIQGYGFQPNIDVAAISTSNMSISAFYDFANIQVPVYGYNSFSAGPNILEIPNNSNYNGATINPTIPTLTGNAGVYGYGFYPTVGTVGTNGQVIGINMNPTITTLGTNGNFQAVTVSANIATMGATSNLNGFSWFPNVTTSHGNINGIQINPTISGGDATFTGIQISPNGGATLNNPQAISINLNNIKSTDPQGVVGINSDSRLQINSSTQLMSAQTFQIGSRIENLFTIPLGSPVTGTDSLAINIAGDLEALDDMALGPFGLGFVSGSSLTDMAVAAGKTVASVTAFLPTITFPDPGFPTGGAITDAHMVRTTAPLSQGGTAVITNLYAFMIDPAFGDFGAAATNSWGLYLDGTCQNYIASSIAIGTASKKVTNASVALEVGGTTKAVVFTNVTTTQKNALTALPGMQVFDTTLNQMSYYNGTTWINF